MKGSAEAYKMKSLIDVRTPDAKNHKMLKSSKCHLSFRNLPTSLCGKGLMQNFLPARFSELPARITEFLCMQ